MEKIVSKKLFFLAAPVVVLILYILLANGFGLLLDDGVLGQSLVNLAVILCGTYLYYKILRQQAACKKLEPFRPKAWSVFLFVCCIVLLWFFTQCMAFCIGQHVTDTGMDAYADTANANLTLYVLMSVFLSPPAEEFLFRGGLFKMWLRVMHPLLAMILSSALFAIVHGTWQHLPVGFLVGMFCCVMWELTGRILFPMVVHILFNFLSVSAMIPVTGTGNFLFSVWFNVLMFIVLFVSILVLYRNRKVVRDYVTSEHLIDRLNRKWDEE